MTSRERREALGWSRTDLGRASKVDRSVIQLIEIGEYHDDDVVTMLDAALTAEEKRRAEQSH